MSQHVGPDARRRRARQAELDTRPTCHDAPTRHGHASSPRRSGVCGKQVAMRTCIKSTFVLRASTAGKRALPRYRRPGPTCTHIHHHTATREQRSRRRRRRRKRSARRPCACRRSARRPCRAGSRAGGTCAGPWGTRKDATRGRRRMAAAAAVVGQPRALEAAAAPLARPAAGARARISKRMLWHASTLRAGSKERAGGSVTRVTSSEQAI